MVKKNKKKNEKKIMYIIIGTILILILFAIIFMPKNNKNQSEEIEEELTEEQMEVMEQEADTALLQEMEERDRMEYYFGKFLEKIENEEYEKAYGFLYQDFKNTYFPTLEDFTKYVQKTFSEMSDIEHENIERNGDVYVLWIRVGDVLNAKPNEKKPMNIVIKENDYNDFVMSFSVIENEK